MAHGNEVDPKYLKTVSEFAALSYVFAVRLADKVDAVGPRAVDKYECQQASEPANPKSEAVPRSTAQPQSDHPLCLEYVARPHPQHLPACRVLPSSRHLILVGLELDAGRGPRARSPPLSTRACVPRVRACVPWIPDELPVQVQLKKEERKLPRVCTRRPRHLHRVPHAHGGARRHVQVPPCGHRPARRHRAHDQVRGRAAGRC